MQSTAPTYSPADAYRMDDVTHIIRAYRRGYAIRRGGDMVGGDRWLAEVDAHVDLYTARTVEHEVSYLRRYQNTRTRHDAQIIRRVRRIADDHLAG